MKFKHTSENAKIAINNKNCSRPILNDKDFDVNALDHFVTCHICGYIGREITTHIKHHDMTVAQYKEKYNLHSLKSNALVNNMTGKNNPAYNHGGKYSPFSKKFIKFTDENDRLNLIKKAHDNRAYNDYNSNIYYYIKRGATVKEAHKLLSKRQATNTLENYIKTHGKELGTLKFNQRKTQWSKLNIHKNNKGTVSKQELQFIDWFLKEINVDNNDCEFQLKLTSNNKSYFYDIYIPKYNIIIEYDGDYWHCNPNLYEENYYHSQHKKYAREIWELDNIKESVAKDMGHLVLRVSESNFKNNKNTILEDFHNMISA